MNASKLLSLTFHTIFLFYFFTFRINAQENVISGRVYNEFEETLRNVNISVLGTETNTVSDIRGFFKIKADIKDTLIFSKEFYIDSAKILSDYDKIKIILNFDTELFIKTADADSTIFKPDSLHGSCQPLYILNGTLPSKCSYIVDLTEEDIKTIKVIKGKEAVQKFGVYAANGAIWITTKKDLIRAKKKYISITAKSDILNAPYGIGVSSGTDSIFNRKFPISYSTFFNTDFRDNYALNLGLTKPDVYKIFNSPVSLSFNFNRKHYISNNFDFKEFSISNGISIYNFYWELGFGIQELNSNRNVGVETELSYFFRRIKMSFGTGVGYRSDYMTYYSGIWKPLFKSKFSLGLYYERIDNFDIYKVNLSYKINYWKKYDEIR